MRFLSVALLASGLPAVLGTPRFLMYADEWHPTRPTNPEDRAGIDHVVLAFAMANATANFQPKVPISTIRSEYPNAKVLIAVGGWGDDIGFFEASKSDDTIQKFAADVATMLTNTGADGVDIDWEYPGGNGADYKQVPNSEKVYQVEAFPKVLVALRSDMIAFTAENGPKIWPSVDYINVMTYDLMNRRDNITKHHTSVAGSIDTIENYLAIGAPPEKINLGFAYYAKFFTTQGDCGPSALDCPIVLAEDPITGKDLLTSGAWTFEKFHMQAVDTSALTVSWDGTCGPEKGTKCATGCCSQYGNCGTSPEHCSGACQHAFGTGCTDSDVAGSWQSAAQNGVTDEEAGGQYYFDPQNRLFWTWDTPELITRKFEQIVDEYGLGGVMAWSLGEDSYDWSHIRQMAAELAKREGQTSPSHTPPVETPVVEVSPVEVEAPPSEEPPVELEDPQVDPVPVEQEPPAQEDAPIGRPAPTDDDLPFDPSVFENPKFLIPDDLSLERDPDQPYDVVWVDGTEEGPEGDHSEEPGSPPDFLVNFEGEGPTAPQEGNEWSADSVEEHPTEPFVYVDPIEATDSTSLEELERASANLVEPLEGGISQEEDDATWARPVDEILREGGVRPAGVGRLNAVLARPIGAAHDRQYAAQDKHDFGRSCHVRRKKRTRRI
ncbi:glycoside hydrolase superfamily [Pyrenochaeta sp. MPI-SDFR-AT-0127]|nr:glycoside hydrolase superfamily [Pyrenochaeta sp. MPI-SDFR-AT-0127]